MSTICDLNLPVSVATTNAADNNFNTTADNNFNTETLKVVRSIAELKTLFPEYTVETAGRIDAYNEASRLAYERALASRKTIDEAVAELEARGIKVELPGKSAGGKRKRDDDEVTPSPKRGPRPDTIEFARFLMKLVRDNGLEVAFHSGNMGKVKAAVEAAFSGDAALVNAKTLAALPIARAKCGEIIGAINTAGGTGADGAEAADPVYIKALNASLIKAAKTLIDHWVTRNISNLPDLFATVLDSEEGQEGEEGEGDATASEMDD